MTRLEPVYPVRDVRRLFFPTRSLRWVKRQILRGSFGPALRDRGGWMVRESGIQAYYKTHELQPG